jgi:hypothetical protein
VSSASAETDAEGTEGEAPVEIISSLDEKTLEILQMRELLELMELLEEMDVLARMEEKE